MSHRCLSRHTALVLLWIAVLPATVPQTRADAPAPDSTRWEKAIKQFERIDAMTHRSRNSVLFVGSSSIRMWKASESFPQYSVINRGFGGSQIPDVLYYMDRIVLPYHARAIVFYAGDNDVADGRSAQQVADDFAEFVKRVEAAQKNTPILYLPIKPSIARWDRWPEMKKANGLIEAQAKENKNLYYVDTATPMLGDDGQPRKELFRDDGLHLNEKGYALWNGILTPVLEKRCPPMNAVSRPAKEAAPAQP
jgi:lysophospholipase L1-like esterase